MTNEIKFINNAIDIANHIESLYNELDYEGYDFFNIYHDVLKLQMDGAWFEVQELENYIDNPTKKYGDITGKDCAKICIKNLKNTLVYAKAVIKLQQQTKDLPTRIFG
jgi:hypothetical protein